MPEPVTQQAERVLSLWQGSWIAAFGVGILVWGLIIWSVIFHRKRSDRLPPQVRYNMPIEVLYTVVPFVIIAVLFYFTARDQDYLLETDEQPDVVVNVTAFQWSWRFDYYDAAAIQAAGDVDLLARPEAFGDIAELPEEPHGEPTAEQEAAHEAAVAAAEESAELAESLPEPVATTVGEPGEAARPDLYLPEGQVVRFNLYSPDVIHSFWIPAFLFKLDVIPGQINTFQVIPTTPGTYEGRCAELCGVDHSQMLFQAHVVEGDAFPAQLAEVAAANPDAPPPGADDENEIRSGGPAEEPEPQGGTPGGTETPGTPEGEPSSEPSQGGAASPETEPTEGSAQ
ncbi:cytochrome c oxidase subunit II [Allonocardiopsis opalescens]|uniref:cytochrome-c oxidase n=1 Tax=Allonocardiopsis opalescens TaxID=1144618 RepID=A0A2T0PZS9_9ACTN|nr:cytochrome c oxidase subunit II [Allonocardiopsis opalescens]PRX97050.1 cytochrome c oxidase subunit 2 [Allonocardiopsis opalescens]